MLLGHSYDLQHSIQSHEASIPEDMQLRTEGVCVSNSSQCLRQMCVLIKGIQNSTSKQNTLPITPGQGEEGVLCLKLVVRLNMTIGKVAWSDDIEIF